MCVAGIEQIDVAHGVAVRCADCVIRVQFDSIEVERSLWLPHNDYFTLGGHAGPCR